MTKFGGGWVVVSVRLGAQWAGTGPLTWLWPSWQPLSFLCAERAGTGASVRGSRGGGQSEKGPRLSDKGWFRRARARRERRSGRRGDPLRSFVRSWSRLSESL